MAQLGMELRVGYGGGIGSFEFIQSGHDGLWHEAPAKLAKIAARIGQVADVGADVGFGHVLPSFTRYAAVSRRENSGLAKLNALKT